MTVMSELERSYRRLLAWYPREHRRAHGEEMLGVLMAGARDGQRRPDYADAADLILGALRMRLRVLGGGARDSRWRDALAVVSVLAPVLLLADGLATSGLVSVALHAAEGNFENPFWLAYPSVWPQVFGPAVTVALVLLCRRRTAALAAAATTVSNVAVHLAGSATYLYSAGVALWLILGVLATAALAVPPGPQRGLRLLGPWWTAASAVAALALATVAQGVDIIMPLLRGHRAAVIIAAALGVAALVCLRGAVGRRVLALLSIPAVPFVLDLLVVNNSFGGGPPGVLLYAPPLLAVSLIIALSTFYRRRNARRASPPGGRERAA